MKKKIVKVNYGLASSYSDIIEINKKLTGDLYNKILRHEKGHDDDFYNLNDLMNDFNSKDSYFFESLIFSLKNPECLINFFILMYSYHFKKFTYNLSAIFPFAYFNLIFISFWYLLFRINPIYSFICYVSIYILINITLLIYTHYYVSKHS